MTDRDQLIIEHWPLAKKIGEYVHRRCPSSSIEITELQSIATEHLILELPKFDPSKGVTLKRWLSKTIYHRVVDSLRYGGDGVIYGRKGRTKTYLTLAFDPDSILFERPDMKPSIQALLMKQEQVDQLYAALDQLELRESRIMRLYYLEGFGMREIGEMLCLTESRISQLIRDSLAILRRLLKRQGVLQCAA